MTRRVKPLQGGEGGHGKPPSPPVISIHRPELAQLTSDELVVLLRCGFTITPEVRRAALALIQERRHEVDVSEVHDE